MNAEQKNIKVIIKKSSRARHLRLTVHYDGHIVVTTPIGIRSAVVEDFIVEKQPWIVERLKKFKHIDRTPTRRFTKRDYTKHKETARDLITEKTIRFNELYQFSYNRIFIKNQKATWGSCSEKRNLNFNYKIIFLPEHMQDYIIAHELCHLKEFNHSPRFWTLVAQTIPNPKSIKKELRHHELLFR